MNGKKVAGKGAPCRRVKMTRFAPCVETVFVRARSADEAISLAAASKEGRVEVWGDDVRPVSPAQYARGVAAAAKAGEDQDRDGARAALLGLVKECERDSSFDRKALVEELSGIADGLYDYEIVQNLPALRAFVRRRSACWGRRPWSRRPPDRRPRREQECWETFRNIGPNYIKN
jgi:hypothetical protein